MDSEEYEEIVKFMREEKHSTYETLNNSKLNKMEIHTGNQWSKLIKSAVIATNSTRKRPMDKLHSRLCGEGSPGIKIFCESLTTCSPTMKKV